MGNVMKTVWNKFVGQRISTKRNGLKSREINFNIFSIVPARLFCGDQSDGSVSTLSQLSLISTQQHYAEDQTCSAPVKATEL